MENNNHDPFEYYLEPKNGWEVIRWAMRDELRLRRYTNTLNLSFWAERKLFLRYYFFYLIPWILVRVIPLWVLGLGLMTMFDLPNITPVDWWKPDIVKEWKELSSWWEKWGYLLQHQWREFLYGFVFSMFFGLFFGLYQGLVVGLIATMIGGIVISLAGGIGRSLHYAYLGGLTLGVISISTTSLFRGLASSLGFILPVMIGIAWGGGFDIGILGNVYIPFGGSIGVGLVWLFHFWYMHRSVFFNNPYLKWSGIDLSLWGENKMIRNAKEYPYMAIDFCWFIFENRPQNHNLASLILHAANGKIWENAALQLDEKELQLPDFEVKGFTVPDTWHEQLATVRTALVTAETTTQISIKKRLYEGFVAELDKMYQLALNPYPKPTGFRERLSVPRYYDWHEYYRTALKEWKRIAAQELAKITQKAKEMEPMAFNLYKTGDKLTRTDHEVYIERADLREHLSRILHTSNGFSVIFLQGQRRVGKTSLLTFLPEMLGRRYAIAYYDLQGNVASVPDFLVKLRQSVNSRFRIQEEQPWQPPEDWSAALSELYAYAGAYAQQREVRLILALDEYESLHRHLQANEAAGAEFLATFRHWNQKQVDISVMWIGLKFFSELQQPNWSTYFVEAIPIQVPYLNRPETDKLLNVSTLRFAPGLRDRLFQDTQGHPALIQKIGFALVDIANGAERKDITFEDYEAALQRMVFITNNGVMDQFYSLNCETNVDKGIAWAILEGKPVPREHQHRLRRLVEYGFFVPDGDGYRYRVPLFEQWMNMHFVAYQPL